MTAQSMSRETRVCLLAFAGLTTAVTFNLFFLQGRRVETSVETAAIVRPQRMAPEAPRTAADAMPAPGEAPASEATLEGVLAPPPQPARPLPVATAPAGNLSRYDIVRTIQKGLAAQGYEPGLSDGLIGTMTRAAIMAYEADNGLALTAEPSEDLMRLIERGPAAGMPARRGPAEVRTNEATALVRNVSQWLAALGYPIPKTEGVMSPALSAAIRDYEASQKMPETGRISAPLVARLSRAGAARTQAAR